MTNFSASSGAVAAIVAALSLSFSANAAEGPEKSATLAESDTAKARAEAATDQLMDTEKNKGMPLPGQGYSHSSLLLDKAKDKEAIEARLDKLRREGKVKTK